MQDDLRLFGVHIQRIKKYAHRHTTWYEIVDIVYEASFYVRWLKIRPIHGESIALLALQWSLLGVADIVDVQWLSPDSEYPNCLEVELRNYGDT